MIYSGVILGLIGSLHCVAMCGPLMLGLSNQNYSYASLIVHHLGRWTGYAMLALLFRLIISPLYIFQIQQYVGLISGALLIVYGLKNSIPFVNRFFQNVSRQIGNKMMNQKPGRQGNFTLGVLNGLLPCGLSFGTAILSINMSTWSNSVLFMVLFGIGTLPALLAVSFLPKINAFKSMKSKWSLASNKTVIILGCIILIRSAQLGIPYVSPAYNVQTEKAECCEVKPDND